MLIRTYTELSQFDTFEERYEYLKLGGEVGGVTFGFDRGINQEFYRSREWRQARNEVIVRDEGCDLGIPGYEIHHELLVHHMNPLTPEDLRAGGEIIVDPEFLIVTTHNTHNAIHYGDASLLPSLGTKRHPGDTQLWSRS